MLFFRRLVAVMTATLLFASVTNAQQPLLTFNFAGATGSQANSPSTFNAVNVNPSVVSRGPGVTASAFADSISANGWTTATTVDANDYFTLTFQSSTITSLSSIVINANRNGLGPRLMEVRDSLSGFNTATTTPIAVPNASLITPLNFNLSGVTVLQNIPANTLVELRIYAYDATQATNSSLAIENAGPIAGLVLNGTPVPEPATVGGLAAAGLFGFGWLRRRFRKTAA